MVRLRLTNEQMKKAVELFKKSLADCHIAKNFNFTLNFKEEIKDVEKPTLNIPSEIYCKMFELVRQSNVEISWHGLVHRANNNYTIYDILVFPQTNTATTTTTDDTEYANWLMQLMMNPEINFNDLRMHGHSHVNMQVFSSGTDDKYQHDIIKNIEDGDYYLFLILNKKHEICALLYDFEQQVLFDTKDITINVGNDIREWAAEEIKEKTKVQQNTYKYPKSNVSNLPIDDDRIEFGHIDRTRNLKNQKGNK